MGTAGLLGSLAGPPSEVAQVVALLAAAGFDEPDRLSIGEADRQLLSLYRSLSGEVLEILAACPACGELSAAEIDPDTVPPASPRMAVLGRGGGLREPMYGDLVDLPADPAQAAAELCLRCLVGSPERAPEA